MPVLSRAHTDAAHFEDQTLQIPLGAGPYKVAEVVPGQRLTLKRDPNYWGARPADQPRPLQFRRDPHRLLPRRVGDVRGVQGGADRFPPRRRPDPLARRLRLSRRARRAVSNATPCPTACQRESPASPSTRAARCSPTRGCAKAWRRCSISSGSTPTSTPAPTAARRASSTTASSPPPAGPPRPRSARCSRRFPARCAPTSSTAVGRRRSPTAPGATARSPARR